MERFEKFSEEQLPVKHLSVKQGIYMLIMFEICFKCSNE